MKLPRDVSGARLVKALAALGYRATRQTGSHIRLTCGPWHIGGRMIRNDQELAVARDRVAKLERARFIPLSRAGRGRNVWNLKEELS